MHDLAPMAIAVGAGLVLGALFYGGLWWTVSRAVSSPRPALWFIGGKLLRTGFALGGFYLVGGGRWERWLLCLLGFVIARLIAWRLSRVPPQGRPGPTSGASFAP